MKQDLVVLDNPSVSVLGASRPSSANAPRFLPSSARPTDERPIKPVPFCSYAIYIEEFIAYA
jgi:hypothetical protein